jgi:hypothetical protein
VWGTVVCGMMVIVDAGVDAGVGVDVDVGNDE